MPEGAGGEVRVPCAWCRGSGWGCCNAKCPACTGKGTVLVAAPPTKCGLCGGTGRTKDYLMCPSCGGTGWAHLRW